MMKWLQAFFPQLTAFKLIAYAVAALALLAVLTFAFFTVKGWHDDAAQLPVVKSQLVQAQADYAALDAKMATRLDGIGDTLTGFGKQLSQIDQARAATDAHITAAQAAAAGDVQNFLKRYQNAVPSNPVCAEPQSVRDGLLDLFPVKPQPQPGPAGGGRQGDGGRGAAADPAGPSGPALAPDAVPGRQHASDGGRGMGMPAAAVGGAGAAERHAAGAARQADRGAAQRGRSPLRAAALAAPASWGRRAGRQFLATLKLIGEALLASAWDDRWDA